MQQDLLTEKEQTFWVTIGNDSFEVRLYDFRNIMYVDVTRAGSDRIVTGQRVIQNQWILPTYLSDKYGNMRFETYDSDGEEYVWYTGFNEKFRFCYYTPSEYGLTVA